MTNPIQEYRLLGIEKLKDNLSHLEFVELISIIKKYMPDNTRKIYKTTDKNKIIDYIIFRSEKLANKGNVFYTK